MFVVSELRTLSGGREEWRYDIDRHMMYKVPYQPNEQTLLVNVFPPALSTRAVVSLSQRKAVVQIEETLLLIKLFS